MDDEGSFSDDGSGRMAVEIISKREGGWSFAYSNEMIALKSSRDRWK